MSDVKSTILARRARFIAAAVAGAGLTIGCSSSQVCLSAAPPPTDSGTEGGDGESDALAEAQGCLSMVLDSGPDADTGPQGCLQPELDSSTDDADAGAQMCLAPPPDDGGQAPDA
ncbi:MAG: hypothetical protein HY898_19225 [Deltaproteobacteria bacterium]|nr:hypothetical protein [Deltaproteobacteria bacterium]